MPGYLLGGDTYQAFDSNGDPLSGGLVYTYEAGTSTPLTTYQAYDGTTLSSANANPVVLDSAGRATIWYGQSMSITVKDSSGTTQYTEDIYVDSFVDTPTSVSNYFYGNSVFINTYDLHDTTSFDIASNIGSSFETLGDTSSGAMNTWAALDDVPSTATALIFTIYGALTPSSGTPTVSIYLQSSDSATSAGVANLAFYQGGASAVYDINSTIIVPCSSAQKVSIAYITTGAITTSTAYLLLQGWIE